MHVVMTKSSIGAGVRAILAKAVDGKEIYNIAYYIEITLLDIYTDGEGELKVFTILIRVCKRHDNPPQLCYHDVY